MRMLAAFFTAFLASAATLPAMQATPAIPTIPGMGDKNRGQFSPTAAFGKDGYLLVWREGLSNRTAKIFAVRLNPEGKALDAQGVAPGKTLEFQHEPAVAFGNGVYLTVFSALKLQKAADGSAASGVFGVRIATEGAILDPTPLPIGDAPGCQAQPTVTFDGENFRVAWVSLLDSDTKINEAWGLQIKGLQEIQTARVSPAGQILDQGAGVLVARGPDGPTWSGLGAVYHPHITRAGDKTMVCFAYGNNYPQAVIFDIAAAGPPDKAARVDLPQIVRKVGRLEGKVIRPVAAGSPTGFAASWSVGRERGWNGPPWIAMVFDLTGKPCDPEEKGVQLPPDAGETPCINPALVFDGEAYVHVWVNHKSNQLLAARFSPEGKLTTPSFLVLEQMGKDKTGRPHPADFSAAALATDGAGATLCLYQKYPAAATGRVEIVGRILKK